MENGKLDIFHDKVTLKSQKRQIKIVPYTLTPNVYIKCGSIFLLYERAEENI